MEENRENAGDSILQKSQEYISKINSIIFDVYEKLGIAFRRDEEEKLKEYKDSLLKTKEKFEQIHESRNDENITKAILQYKKDLEKECTISFDEEMEVSKIYETLKSTISKMNAEERELKLEIEYLKKQCKKTEERGVKLKKEVEALDKRRWNEKKRVLLEIRNEKGKSVEKEREKNAVGHLEETKERLKNRIETTKEYMESLLFVESTFEANFSAYALEEFKTPQRKLELIEEILSKKEVKKQIHELIFN